VLDICTPCMRETRHNRDRTFAPAGSAKTIRITGDVVESRMLHPKRVFPKSF
jgi:hypothetical protein